MRGRSVARSLKSSARTSARPQTHEPGENKQDGGLNTQRGIGAQRKVNRIKTDSWDLVSISKSLCRLIIINSLLD